jgi:hypothetical protein
VLHCLNFLFFRKSGYFYFSCPATNDSLFYNLSTGEIFIFLETIININKINTPPQNPCWLWLDVDECSAANEKLCGLGAQCVNSAGSYDCVCPSGYSGDPKSRCLDVDECAVSPSVCRTIAGAQCSNLPGSYRCFCPVGFQGDHNNNSNNLLLLACHS